MKKKYPQDMVTDTLLRKEGIEEPEISRIISEQFLKQWEASVKFLEKISKASCPNCGHANGKDD